MPNELTNFLSRPFWRAIGPVQLIMLAAIISAVTFFVIQNNPEPNYSKLFEGYQPTQLELHRISLAFGKAKLPDYRIETGQILVPSDAKSQYLSAVEQYDAIPTLFAMEKPAAPNPLLPRSQQRALRFDQKKRHVQNMILQLPFVQEAWVEIDSSEVDSYYHPRKHSAVVMVNTQKQQPLSKIQVSAIQKTVNGAFSQIPAREVVVTDATVGISYDDLNDFQQSEMIDLISWKTERKSHYRDNLVALEHEFPGIAIEIDVRRSSQPKRHPAPKVADKVPVRLTKAPSIPTMKLNANGEIVKSVLADDQLVSIATKIPAEKPAVSQTSYKTNSDDMHFGAAEMVDIHLKIPSQIVDAYDFGEIGRSADRRSGFKKLKSEFVTRVENLLPDLATAKRLNVFVDVSPKSQPMDDLNQKTLSDQLKTYWPIAAVLAIGLFSMITNLIPNRNKDVERHLHRQEEKVDPQALEDQLATLIDQDPEAAASVIKKWIRDAE